MSVLPIAPPATPIVHVALSVSDLEASIDWYTRLFGEPPAFTGSMLDGTAHRYRLAVWTTPNLGLHHFAEQEPGGFNVRRPGLDHVAFGCNVSDLPVWADRLDALGIDRGEILNEVYGAGLAFWDPDGIALEFFAATPRAS